MAIRTYTGTLCRPNLAEAKIELYCFQVSKLERGSKIYVEGEDPKDEEKKILTGVKSWSIVEGGAEAEAIEMVIDAKDDIHEYLVINYLDGRTEIYRNTYVTMFVL